MSVFGENDSRHLPNFLQAHIFWKFDHISRTCNKINYRNIWFEKVAITLIMMAQVFFFDIFSEKNTHLNAVETIRWKSKNENCLVKKSVIIIVVILFKLATMSPFGWYTPHLVDNTDTLYLEYQHWQHTLLVFEVFLFIFVSNCVSSSQSVLTSVCNLFSSFLGLIITIN